MKNSTLTYAGAELRLLDDGLYSCRYCLMRIEKGMLTTTASQTLTGNLADVLNNMPKQVPLALVITGRGILFKSIEHTPDQETALAKAYPAVDAGDFYIQFSKTTAAAHLALARKDLVDSLVDRLTACGVFVAKLSLAAFPVTSIAGELRYNGARLVTDGHVFNFDASKQLLSCGFEHAEMPAGSVKIGDEDVSGAYIVAWAAGFQLLLEDRLNPVQVAVEDVDNRWVSYKENRQLKKNALLIVLAFFAVLLLNTLVLFYFQSENEALTAQAGTYAKDVEQEEQLGQQIDSARTLLKTAGWNNGRNYAVLLNELAHHLPGQLLLKEIVATPATDTAFGGSITVMGTTHELNSLNNWVYQVKGLDWVKLARLDKFMPIESEAGYTFKINIQY